MLLLGLLLTAASAALAVEFVVSNAGSRTVEAFDQSAEVALGTLFVGGVVTALAFALGVAMVVAGARHSLRERRSQRRAAKETRTTLASLQAENRQLRSELERARGGRAPANATAAPSTTPAPAAADAAEGERPTSG